MNTKVDRERAFAICTIVLFVALIANCAVATAQYQTVTLADPIYVRSLSGHIQDPNKDAVRNAQVELFDLESGQLLASTTTDGSGNFHFERFAKSSYKLRVSMRNFNPLKATLRIKKTAPQSAIITLAIAT
ncbi:MAG TPA: carboxypeptidase-like regulatory domain-containing protein [Edaphobacter sp.]